jgi:ribosomal protein L33
MKNSTAVRKKVEEQAKNLCEYCLSRQDYSPQPFSIDHIYPKSKKGSDELDNLALACQACNNYKYNKTKATDPITKLEVPIYNPRKDVWDEHFVWNEDFTELIGISPIGRATINSLKLNRKGVKNLRYSLHLIGKHPPK